MTSNRINNSKWFLQESVSNEILFPKGGLPCLLCPTIFLHPSYSIVHQSSFIFFFFSFLFTATPVAYGSPRARDWIGAAAAGLYHSHSNAGSLIHRTRPGVKPTSLQGQHRVLNLLVHNGISSLLFYIFSIYLFYQSMALWGSFCHIPEPSLPQCLAYGRHSYIMLSQSVEKQCYPIPFIHMFNRYSGVRGEFGRVIEPWGRLHLTTFCLFKTHEVKCQLL